jgi:hypothetical protein
MRKYVFSAIAVLAFWNINAQDEKLDLFPRINQNNWYVGGKTKLSFSSQEYAGDKIKESSFRFNPNIGYFPIDRWGISLSPGYETQTTEYPNMPESKYNEFSLGLETRYYLMPNKQNTNFFLSAGYNVGSYKYDNDPERTSFNRYNFGASFVYFKNPHVGLEIGFDYGSRKYEEEERINRFGLCAGLQIHLDPCGRNRRIEAE